MDYDGALVKAFMTVFDRFWPVFRVFPKRVTGRGCGRVQIRQKTGPNRTLKHYCHTIHDATVSIFYCYSFCFLLLIFLFYDDWGSTSGGDADMAWDTSALSLRVFFFLLSNHLQLDYM